MTDFNEGSSGGGVADGAKTDETGLSHRQAAAYRS